MEYRYLGRTGLKVSELCLGAMHFGGDTGEPDARAILDAYAEAGGTFIDTADCYHLGESERVLGRWLKGRDRDAFVIATKVYVPMGDGPNDGGLSRKHILAGVEASLRRLGTDHLDVYYTHVYDERTPLDETLSTLDTLVRSGKVRYLGASNILSWQLQKAVDLSEHRGWARYDVLQPLFNLLDNETEWDLLPMCREAGIGVASWSPLRGGWLTDRFRRGMTAPPEGSRIAHATETGAPQSWSAYAGSERTWAILDALHGIAAETGRTVAQVAVNWVARTPGVTAPIIGPRTRAHLADGLGAVGWALPGEQYERLRKAAEKPMGYPYEMVRRYRRD